MKKYSKAQKKLEKKIYLDEKNLTCVRPEKSF
jgi:hypothetical protein